MDGFITDDGYGVIPYGKQLMIIYNNEQLTVVKTKKAAEKFITDNKAKLLGLKNDTTKSRKNSPIKHHKNSL
jgi:hypothetical protein